MVEEQQSASREPLATAWPRYSAAARGFRNYWYPVMLSGQLGKQPVGNWPFSVAMGPAGLGLLRWPVPGVVRDIDIEDKRIVIQTR